MRKQTHFGNQKVIARYFKLDDTIITKLRSPIDLYDSHAHSINQPTINHNR